MGRPLDGRPKKSWFGALPSLVTYKISRQKYVTTCHEISACQTHHAWLAWTNSTRENDRYISRILKFLPDKISVLEISGKGLWLLGSQTSARTKNHEELTGFCQPSYSCSLFCACQKHTATRFKTKFAARFSVLFFHVRLVEKIFSNQERRARCKLRTSSFTMCLIKLLNICLAAFDVHQAQGGKVVHSQVWWQCFKSLLGAPQRNWKGSKLKATGVLYQTCPFRHFALMLFITFSSRIFLCFIFFYCSTN